MNNLAVAIICGFWAALMVAYTIYFRWMLRDLQTTMRVLMTVLAPHLREAVLQHILEDKDDD